MPCVLKAAWKSIVSGRNRHKPQQLLKETFAAFSREATISNHRTHRRSTLSHHPFHRQPIPPSEVAWRRLRLPECSCAFRAQGKIPAGSLSGWYLWCSQYRCQWNSEIMSFSACHSGSIPESSGVRWGSFRVSKTVFVVYTERLPDLHCFAQLWSAWRLRLRPGAIPTSASPASLRAKGPAMLWVVCFGTRCSKRFAGVCLLR